MLVKLMNGVCLDPGSVRYINVRGEMVKEGNVSKQVFHVAVKYDDEMLKVGTYDDRAEAERMSELCADKINDALNPPPEPDLDMGLDDDLGMGLDDDLGLGGDDEDLGLGGEDDEDLGLGGDDEDLGLGGDDEDLADGEETSDD